MEIAGLRKPLTLLLPVIMCLCYILISFRLLSGYLIWDITVYIGIAIIPYVCRIESGSKSLRFLIPALLFILLAVFIPAKSTLFFTLVFTICCYLKISWGRLA